MSGPPTERAQTLMMVWPEGGAAPAASIGEEALRFSLDRAAFEQVQAAAGWRVSEAQWSQLVAEHVPGSMVLVEHDGEPIGAACALQRAGGWAELAWVAVAVEHRGRGLGARVCTALTRHLLASGRSQLFGSTQDARLAALRIYLDLGFHPVYRAQKVARWRRVCAALEQPWTPDRWGWPAGSV